MRKHALRIFLAACISGGLAVVGIGAQQAAENPHLAIARAATVGYPDAKDLFDNLCGNAPPGGGAAGARGAQPGARGGQPGAPGAAAGEPPAPRATPEYSTWHQEPVRVFDNLYFVGSRSATSWLITTSAGIIIEDSLNGYDTKDEIYDGLQKLGFKPEDVKILILSHGHPDHAGGAKILQDLMPWMTTYLAKEDWDMVAKTRDGSAPPKIDKAITDGMKLTLGDETITMTIVPGHTPGNTAMLIPVREGNHKHLAMLWAGTGLQQTSVEYFRQYAASAAKFREVEVKAGADVLIGGHMHRDGSLRKIPLLATRKPGDPNPYVTGKDATNKVMTVISECSAYRGDLAEAKLSK